ncbi:MAG: DUF3108 domain-containing protein [Deltaproteobacteria bacterium]|nr:DUF3108 domain-containing protein [Deltaproteobacteria bacterium]
MTMTGNQARKKKIVQKRCWGRALVGGFISLLVFCPLIHGVGAMEGAIPFFPGERLTYEVKWSFIPAGKVILEVLPVETIDGVQSYHFVMTAKTYPAVDVFYKVRDRVDSYAPLTMTHAILYRKRNEGNHKRDVTVSFNWEDREVRYSNFGRRRDPVSIQPGTFDPLSVFYAFRSYDLCRNREIECPVTDGKKWVVGKAKIIRKELVTLACGMYDTFLVEPDLEHIGGVFEKSKDATLQIWVTADGRRIPVRFKSKVRVGSFVGELVAAEGVGGDNWTAATAPDAAAELGFAEDKVSDKAGRLRDEESPYRVLTAPRRVFGNAFVALPAPVQEGWRIGD